MLTVSEPLIIDVGPYDVAVDQNKFTEWCRKVIVDYYCYCVFVGAFQKPEFCVSQASYHYGYGTRS